MRDSLAPCLADAQQTHHVGIDAAASDEIKPVRRCPHCGEEFPTLAEQIERRLAVPATPSELAALFDMTLHQMRGNLTNLKRSGRITRLERTVPHKAARGRQYEHLWARV